MYQFTTESESKPIVTFKGYKIQSIELIFHRFYFICRCNLSVLGMNSKGGHEILPCPQSILLCPRGAGDTKVSMIIFSEFLLSVVLISCGIYKGLKQ